MIEITSAGRNRREKTAKGLQGRYKEATLPHQLAQHLKRQIRGAEAREEATLYAFLAILAWVMARTPMTVSPTSTLPFST